MCNAEWFVRWLIVALLLEQSESIATDRDDGAVEEDFEMSHKLSVHFY